MSDKTKNMIVGFVWVAGLTAVTVYLLRPRKAVKSSEIKTSEDLRDVSRSSQIQKPKKADADQMPQMDNANVAINAYYDAKKAGEGKANLDKLNSALLEEYGIKVYEGQGKLIARDAKGNDIAVAKV